MSTPKLRLEGTLEQAQQAIDSFLQQLTLLLQPAADATQDHVNMAVLGIKDFVQFLKGQDIPGKLETLTPTVRTVFQRGSRMRVSIL